MLLAQLQYLLPQACAIPRRVGWTRRTLRAILPERQVVSQRFDALFGECVCKRNEQRRIAIRSSAVSE